MLSALLAAVLLVGTAGALPPAQTSPDPASGPPWSAAVESARAGRYDEAITRSTQLLEREPDQLTSRLIRAMSYYFTAEPKGDHPFKAIPDFYGKYEKATGAENRKQLSYQGLPDPKLDVPPDLRVKLNDEITVGAIQVRPTAVTHDAVATIR